MECHICYEIVTEDNIEFLECSHSLCQSCLSKLRNSLCPFCRAPIRYVQVTPLLETPPTPISSPIQLHVDPDIGSPIRSRRRRQRRERRTLSLESCPVPLFLNLDEINEILSNLCDTTTSRLEASSTSDTERQKRRSGRNRWRQNIAHNGTRNMVR